jgi:hypothetical protein
MATGKVLARNGHLPPLRAFLVFLSAVSSRDSAWRADSATQYMSHLLADRASHLNRLKTCGSHEGKWQLAGSSLHPSLSQLLHHVISDGGNFCEFLFECSVGPLL